ncbi:MAG: isocitrate lyase/phosphoenolpyruvate mutase family protein [Bryobacterales bacterium]|nr:isocitrate lyase/phosphoenolpyruvate mutase family protein [Bryobacterales bacterium]
MSTWNERRAAFRRLHEAGCFVIPNPWDAGSARILESLGFSALATTSGGAAFSQARPDGGVAADVMLAHIAALTASVELPMNADFEDGYASDAAGVAANVRRCLETGVAGLSIEDATGDPNQPLYTLDTAVDRLRAARHAIDESGTGVLLTGRAECFLVRAAKPLEESLRRLRAYRDAGADVLYAPGVRTRDEIAAVVEAAHPKPVNVLISANTGLSVADLASLGVRRVSLGSALARCAWGGFLRAAREIATRGAFTELDGAEPFPALNGFFAGAPPRG